MPSIRERLKERFSRRKAATQATYAEFVQQIAEDPSAEVDLDELEAVLDKAGVDENQLDRDVGIIRRERELDAVIAQEDERKEALREVVAESKAANDEFDEVRAAHDERTARLAARIHAATHRVNQVESAVQERKGLRGKLHAFRSKEKVQLDRIERLESEIERMQSEIATEEANEEPNETLIGHLQAQIGKSMADRNEAVRNARDFGAMRDAEEKKFPV